MTETEARGGSESRHRTFWVGFVFALLGSQIVLMLVMVVIAVNDRSFAVVPDYYQKGLDWDATATQIQENARLGWSVEIALGERTGPVGERTLQCTLTDSTGNPLEDADVRVVAFPHARGSQRVSTRLMAIGSGTYESPMKISHRGLWEFRVSVERADDSFTHTSVLTIHQDPGDARS